MVSGVQLLLLPILTNLDLLIRVRICDERVGDIVMLLAGGHHDAVTCVQMDEWKVLSGGQDGYVCTWDQRMTHKLWDMYSR